VFDIIKDQEIDSSPQKNRLTAEIFIMVVLGPPPGRCSEKFVIVEKRLQNSYVRLILLVVPTRWMGTQVCQDPMAYVHKSF
jgi:hypothetical protein